VPALSGRLYELIPGFLAGLAATVLVSLATRPPAGVEAMFDAMERPLGREPAAAPEPRR
jgi:hypothetical protein